MNPHAFLNGRLIPESEALVPVTDRGFLYGDGLFETIRVCRGTYNEQVTIPGEPNIFSHEDRAFVDSVKAGKRQGILATYEDGLKATAIACAANRSMETGRVEKVQA